MTWIPEIAEILSRQLKTLDALTGKTIKRITGDDAAVFHFTDGSWARFVVDPGWDGDPGDVAFDDESPDIHALRYNHKLDPAFYDRQMTQIKADDNARRIVNQKRDDERNVSEILSRRPDLLEAIRKGKP